MEPNKPLWDRYLQEIDRQLASGAIVEEDYVLLRYSLEASRALVDITLGDVAELTAGSVADILRRARDRRSRDLVNQLKEAQDVGAARESELLGKLESLQTVVDEGVLSSARRKAELDSRIHDLASRFGRIMSWTCYLLMILFVAAGGVGSILGLPVSVGVFGAIAALAILVFLAFGLTHMTLGVTIRDVKRHIENWVSTQTYRVLCAILRLKPVD